MKIHANVFLESFIMKRMANEILVIIELALNFNTDFVLHSCNSSQSNILARLK